MRWEAMGHYERRGMALGEDRRYIKFFCSERAAKKYGRSECRKKNKEESKDCRK